MPRAEWLLIMFLTVTRKVSYLLEVFALLVCGEKVLVQGIDQNISESFVGNNFFLGIPLAPSTLAVYDVTIGTPFDQADYIIESNDGEIASGTVTSSNPAVVRVGSSYQVTSSGFTDRVKGIRVHTTSPNQIYVLVVTSYNDFGSFRSIFGYGSYLVHPNNEFSSGGDYVYFAVSFAPNENSMSNVLLIGNHNETFVSLTPAQNVSLPLDAGSNSLLIEVAAGTTHNVTLSRFQTLGFSTAFDLTGTKIISDKPLTVITGHQCAKIPSTTGFCEPLYIHLPPTFNWGQSFLLAPFGGRTADQYYKVVTSVDSTTIHYRCGSNDSVSLERPTAGSGHLLSFSSDSYCYLNASSPVFLVQMSPGSSDNSGDPALAIVPPTSGYVKSASFLNLPSDFPNNFITVTLLAEDFITSQILFDGNTLACSWNVIHNTFSDDIVGYGCTYSVSSGTHVVTYSGDDGVLSVIAYGWDNSPPLGYAYLTNFNLKSLVPGQVIALECPASGDAAVLPIRWTQPSTNADSVHGYTVQVHQYTQNGRELVPLPLDPPFDQQLETLETSVMFGVEMFLPYHVTVTPCNAAWCGLSISIHCFTQEGVPTVSPAFMNVTRSEENPSVIVVTWQPLTLLEARGFIEYLIQLYEVGSIKRQVLSQTVPMDEDSATFSDLNTTANYEVSVGTRTVSSGDTGPVSARVTVPPAPTTTAVTGPLPDSTDPQIPVTTIIIGLCVVVFVVVAMVIVSIIVIVVVHSRHSSLDTSKDLKSPSDSSGGLNAIETQETHDYEYIAESTPLPLLTLRPDEMGVNRNPAYATTQESALLPLLPLRSDEMDVNRNPAYATTQESAPFPLRSDKMDVNRNPAYATTQESTPLPLLPLRSDEIDINRNPAYATTQDTNEIRNPEYATTQGQRSAEGVMESVYAEIHGEAEGERSKEPVYEDIKCMQSK